MVNVAREMRRQGFTQPLLIGGATTSPAHTSVRIEPEYPIPLEKAGQWVLEEARILIADLALLAREHIRKEDELVYPLLLRLLEESPDA